METPVWKYVPLSEQVIHYRYTTMGSPLNFCPFIWSRFEVTWVPVLRFWSEEFPWVCSTLSYWNLIFITCFYTKLLVSFHSSRKSLLCHVILVLVIIHLLYITLQRVIETPMCLNQILIPIFLRVSMYRRWYNLLIRLVPR